LFGRFTAILRNSGRLVPLEQRLEVLSSLVGSGGEAPSEGSELEPLFAEASRELSEQFAAEEADGYYGAIVAEEPALRARVGELKRDHLAILRAIEVLRAVSSDESLRWQLGACTRDLVSKLRAHDQAEQLLLHDLFWGNGKRDTSRSGTYSRTRLAYAKSPSLVLLVDDESDVRSVVRRMLEHAGCRVLEAADASLGLRLLVERRSAVSAIVSDVELPEISGPDFVRAARVLCPHVAALHISAEARDYLIATGRIAPDAVLLEKPFRGSDLMACLTTALERQRQS
jgi:CheY-like chemotaxis protein